MQVHLLLSPGEFAAVEAARALHGCSRSDQVAAWAREACAANHTDSRSAEALRLLSVEDETPRSKRGRPATIPQTPIAGSDQAVAGESPAQEPAETPSAPPVDDESGADESPAYGRPGRDGGAVPRYCRLCRTFLGLLRRGDRTRCRGCGRHVVVGE